MEKQPDKHTIGEQVHSTQENLTERTIMSLIDQTQSSDGDSISKRFYVYALAYPDGRVFYIGKGQGNRIQDHELEARAGKESQKCDIIREIWIKGQEVLKTKLAFFDKEVEALKHEAKLIHSLNGLANIASGRKYIRDIFIYQIDRYYFGASVCQIDENGEIFWKAREVADFLGYTTWQAFHATIKRAMRNLGRAGNDTDFHFRPTYKIAQVGKSKMTRRSLTDYRLSREAFLMVIMNADMNNPIVALGKHYIAYHAAAASGPVRNLRGEVEPLIPYDGRDKEELAIPQHIPSESPLYHLIMKRYLADV